MSRYIIRTHLLKTILEYSEKAPKEVTIGIGSCIVATNCIYAYGTKNENHEIVVKSKYTYCRNGFTDFMVIDENGKHYNVTNSFWYWKWNSIEDWNRMEPDRPVVVTFFGWRIPIFGLFPNIVHSGSNSGSIIVSKSDPFLYQ